MTEHYQSDGGVIKEAAIRFASRFLGYGDPSSRVWAIGMEERGCGTTVDPILEEALLRIRSWQAMGSTEYIDLNIFLIEAKRNEAKCCEAESRTWNALAYGFSEYFGKSAIDCVGTAFPKRLAPHLFLSEFQPLPCQKTGEWPWGQWLKSEFPRKKLWLQSELIQDRCQRLGKLMTQKSPKVVLVYGQVSDSLLKILSDSSGRAVVSFPTCGVWPQGAPRFRDVIVQMPHPASRGFRPKIQFGALAKAIGSAI